MATTRIRGPNPPIAPQLELERRWGVIASTTWGLISTELLPAYRIELGLREDALSLPRRLAGVLASMARGLVARVPVRRLRAAVAAAADSVDRSNAAAYDRQLSVALGQPVRVVPRARRETVRQLIREATAKITSVRAGAIPGLRADLEEAWARGLPAADLERRWRQRGLPLEFGTIEGRTRTIAADQLGKLNGRLTEIRQRAMGVKGYTWRRNPASRTRPSHRRRDGRRFSWRRPPSDGHPGQPVRCVCSAEAVVRLEVAAASPEVVAA